MTSRYNICKKVYHVGTGTNISTIIMMYIWCMFTILYGKHIDKGREGGGGRGREEETEGERDRERERNRE